MWTIYWNFMWWDKKIWFFNANTSNSNTLEKYSFSRHVTAIKVILWGSDSSKFVIQTGTFY